MCQTKLQARKMCGIAIVNRTWGDDGKRSQNAQPQNEILRSKGLGGAVLNKQFVAMDSHKHCLLL